MKRNQAGTQGLPVGEWLRSACCRLPESASSPCLSDDQSGAEITLAAQVLTAYVLGQTRAWVLAHPEFILEENEQARLDVLFQHFCSGTPLPYLTGNQEFFSLDFEVTPDVLIPRPETELLVERAIAWLENHPKAIWATDVGTGSGCIAVSVALRAPQVQWLAVDRSWNAIQVARRNAIRHRVAHRIHFVQCDLLSSFKEPFNLVCANLPYIPTEPLKKLPVAVYEPFEALNGGEDGLSLIRGLLYGAKQWLAPGGAMLLEMQYDQGEQISKLVKSVLPGAQTNILSDLAGLPRVVEVQYF